MNCIHVHYGFALNNKSHWKLDLSVLYLENRGQLGNSQTLKYVIFFHIVCENMTLFLLLKTQNHSQACML